MPNEKNLSTLIINDVESNEVFNKMKDKGFVNENELYIVEDGEANDLIDNVPTKNSKNLVYSGGVFDTTAPATHAAQHKTGGSDPLTAADIGAAPDSLISANHTINTLDELYSALSNDITSISDGSVKFIKVFFDKTFEPFKGGTWVMKLFRHNQKYTQITAESYTTTANGSSKILYTSMCDGVWQEWILNVNATNITKFAAPAGSGENGKLTVADIGAAPAGYGFGGESIPIIKVNSADETYETFCAKIDAVADTMKAESIKMVIAYPPVLYGRNNSQICVLYKSDPSIVLYNLSSADTGLNGWVMKKTKLSSSAELKWHPLEWINPPMVPGEEYRTTERYNGKPVYAQLFEIDNLPYVDGTSYNSYEFEETKNQGCQDIVSFSGYTSNYKTIPTMNHQWGAIGNGDAIALDVFAHPTYGIRIYIATQHDRSAVSAKVLVKYTKS